MINTPELFGTPTKSIMDPVHGSIPIFSYELDIINHSLFQRLRHILQNDVVFIVFPGAKHNRFLHSIGTMHMVSTIFKHLCSSYLAQITPDALSQEQKTSIQYIHCCLRLAALLHDTGHQPFSHQFENAEIVKSLMSSSAVLDKLWEKKDFKKYYSNPITRIKHEHISVRIALKILNETKSFPATKLQVDDVLFFMEKTENKPSSFLLKNCTNIASLFIKLFKFKIDDNAQEKILTNFLNCIKTLISGDLDADKMDYILRDSYFSGCKYGLYNKDHLLNSLRIGWDLQLREIVENGKKVNQLFDIDFSLAILKKGLGAFEDFVYCRYQLYIELYNHKTVSGLRKLLVLALTEVLNKEHIKMDVIEKLSNLSLMENFTDTYFWEQFRIYAQEKPVSACAMLINRQKLKYIEEVKENTLMGEKINILCERLTSKLPISRRGKVIIDFWESKVTFSDINNVYEKITVLMPGEKKPKNINKATEFFKKFERVLIYHVFEIPLFK